MNDSQKESTENLVKEAEWEEAEAKRLTDEICSWLKSDQSHTLYGASIHFKMDVVDVYKLIKGFTHECNEAKGYAEQELEDTDIWAH